MCTLHSHLSQLPLHDPLSLSSLLQVVGGRLIGGRGRIFHKLGLSSAFGVQWLHGHGYLYWKMAGRLLREHRVGHMLQTHRDRRPQHHPRLASPQSLLPSSKDRFIVVEAFRYLLYFRIYSLRTNLPCIRDLINGDNLQYFGWSENLLHFAL